MATGSLYARSSAWAGPLSLLTLLSACEIERPSDSYEGGVEWGEQERTMSDVIPDDEDAGGMDDLFSDLGGTTGGLAMNDGGAVGSDAGTTTGTGGGTSGAKVPNPSQKFVGDYYVRVRTISRSDGGRNLGTVETTSTSYGQMRVVLTPDGQLVGEERLCYLENDQDPSRSDASVNTSISDQAVQNFLPIKRTFTVTDSGWHTDVVRRRQGWRPGLPGDEMPTDPSEVEKFRDPDNDGYVGYQTTVSGSSTVGGVVEGNLTCAYDVVSYSDTAYVEGTFGPNGLFASARVDAVRSDLHALYSDKISGSVGQCSVLDLNEASNGEILSDQITLVPVQALPDYTACAAQSAYEMALAGR